MTLPRSWVVSSLGDLTDKGQYGWTTKAAQTGEVRFLRTTDITKGRINWSSVPFCAEIPADLDKYLLEPGDIVISRAGSVGFSRLLAEIPSYTVFASYLIRFKPSSAVVPRYLAAYLNSDAYWKGIGAASVGIALANVNAKSLAALPVPLAPLAEQKRIADKLDTVLTRVDAVNTRLARVAPLLKRFRQSVLAAATSGRLTEDWRLINAADESAAPSLPPPELTQMVIPATWVWKSVGELSTKVTDGVHKKPTYLDQGVPFLTVGNLTGGPGIDFSTTRFVSEEDHQEYCKRTHPERDDILVTKDGTLGVVRRVETDRPFSIFVSLALVKLKDKQQSRYVSIALASPHLQIQMKGVGTGLQHIHLTDLRKDLVPIPPLDEQAEIVSRVETLFAFADRLEARLQTAQTAADRLTPSLLAKAFRGELVPQDPNDEPASELLKRLAAQEPTSNNKRPGRKVKSA